MTTARVDFSEPRVLFTVLNMQEDDRQVLAKNGAEILDDSKAIFSSIVGTIDRTKIVALKNHFKQDFRGEMEIPKKGTQCSTTQGKHYYRVLIPKFFFNAKGEPYPSEWRKQKFKIRGFNQHDDTLSIKVKLTPEMIEKLWALDYVMDIVPAVNEEKLLKKRRCIIL